MSLYEELLDKAKTKSIKDFQEGNMGELSSIDYSEMIIYRLIKNVCEEIEKDRTSKIKTWF